jgi:hypothetical protein
MLGQGKELNMQHAVHNRATIRLADRTDVSGRVTADEVNLDRFHNRIRKVMRSIVRRWLALVSVSLGLYLGLPVCGWAQNHQGQHDRGPGIKPGVPNGTYVFHITGLIPPTPGATTLVPLAAVGRTTYFPNGTDSGVTSFSINGQVLTGVTFKGTFTVNADGSVSETDQQTSPPGLLLHFILYFTPDGNTDTLIQTDPGTIASGIGTRGAVIVPEEH